MLPLQPWNPRVALFSDLTNVHEIYHIQELQKCNQMKNDPRSCKRNLCNCERSLKKIQDFNKISRPQYSIKYSIPLNKRCIAMSRVQIELKPWFFFSGFFRNCIIAFSIARIILHLIILRSLNLEFTLPWNSLFFKTVYGPHFTTIHLLYPDRSP